MRLLILGLDMEVANPESRSAKRQLEYFVGDTVDIIIVSTGESRTIKLHSSVKVHVSGGSYRAISWFRALCMARHILQTNIVDVISAQDPFFCGMAAAIARIGTHTRLHIQDHSGAFSRKLFGFKEKCVFFISRILIVHADRIRTVSQRGAEGLKQFHVDESKIDIIPVARDISSYIQFPFKNSNDAHIVCVARLSFEKGVDILLRALPRICEKFPHARVTIIGDGPERGILENIVKQLGISSSVIFTGAVQDTSALLVDADVYVQPSRYEGYGIAVIEAAAARKPIVMTDVGCANEVIIQGESGLIVPIENSVVLADAVIRILQDKNLAEKLSLYAHNRVMQLPDAALLMHRIKKSLQKTADIRTKKIRLLVVTQRVDIQDTNLGFHILWLREIAKQVASLTVIAQSVGEFDLPSNVRVLTLGKEKGVSKFFQLCRLKFYILRELFCVDAVFVLMVPWYAVLAGWYGIFFRTKVYLWYTHKHIPLSLRIAHFFVKKIFTANDQSLRLDSTKKMVMGHAIDTSLFSPGGIREKNLLITVGRISRSKQISEMIDAVAELHSRGEVIHFVIIGDAVVSDDIVYLKELEQKIIDKKLTQVVHMKRGVSYEQLPDWYRRASVFLNASLTGSVDKVVLEAMSCGCPVITSNEAFEDIVPEGCLVYVIEFSQAIAHQLENPASSDELRLRVVGNHDLSKTIGNIVKIIERNI